AGRGRPLPARGEYPARNDPAQPRSGAGEDEGHHLRRAGRAVDHGGAAMTAAHVRRGGGGRAKTRKSSKVAVPKKIAKRLPMDQARANKVAGLVFGALMLAV